MWVLCQPTLTLDEGFLNQLLCYKEKLLGDCSGLKSTSPKFPSATNLRMWPYLKTESVLVYWDCQKQNTTAWVASTMQCISSEFSKCKIKVLAGLVSPEPFFLGCHSHLSYFVLMWPFLWLWFITDIPCVCPNFDFLDGRLDWVIDHIYGLLSPLLPL